MPAGNGHGVVLGRGKEGSVLLARGGGGGFRRRAIIDERRRSTTYGGVLLGGYDFMCWDMIVGSGVDGLEVDIGDVVGDKNGELGIGRSMSGVLGSVLCSRRDVSYAIVVSTSWRKIMRTSSPRSCILDGA